MSIEKLVGAFALSVVTTLTAVGCAAPTEEEEVGESDNALRAYNGREFTPAEVATLLRETGFPANMIGPMTCVAKYESRYFEGAINTENRNKSVDRGLFQINSVHIGERGCPSNGEALFNAKTNARCALAVYRMQGIDAWVAYRDHERECSAARAPGSAAR